MGQHSVLIIEDDRELGATVVEVLQMLNFEAELITDGSLAYHRIVDRIPDIVLLDIHLPGKSGLDILDEIRADTRLDRTKVIMVSADALRAETAREKADFVLIKPYSASQLLDLATRLVQDKNE